VLAAVSGIDGAGKGYVSHQIAESLEARGMRVAYINIDGWLNLPNVRFGGPNMAEHFYSHAIRFQELFRDLVLPLRDRRSISIEMDFADETATAYRPHRYGFAGIDVILLEGIYLLKDGLRQHYDLSLWVDCTFETALERAISRSQEGLSPEATADAYRTIYFPAQAIHLVRDRPREAANLILVNDPRIAATSA
jgi:uridine kinase